ILKQSASTLLRSRYPHYEKLVSMHIGVDSVGPYRFAITLELFRKSGKPTILLVCHGLGGGVNRHIDSLVARLSDQANFLLLLATDRGATLTVPAVDGHPEVSLPAERLEFALTDEELQHRSAESIDPAGRERGGLRRRRRQGFPLGLELCDRSAYALVRDPLVRRLQAAPDFAGSDEIAQMRRHPLAQPPNIVDVPAVLSGLLGADWLGQFGTGHVEPRCRTRGSRNPEYS
ncbi:MAG: hypothetical protein NT113_11345, partial [Hyphomicrobiales bacterium]|nr:hypothetical protein [Hyphomicrobiales bacterium]